MKCRKLTVKLRPGNGMVWYMTSKLQTLSKAYKKTVYTLHALKIAILRDTSQEQLLKTSEILKNRLWQVPHKPWKKLALHNLIWVQLKKEAYTVKPTDDIKSN